MRTLRYDYKIIFTTIYLDLPVLWVSFKLFYIFLFFPFNLLHVRGKKSFNQTKCPMPRNQTQVSGRLNSLPTTRTLTCFQFTIKINLHIIGPFFMNWNDFVVSFQTKFFMSSLLEYRMICSWNISVTYFGLWGVMFVSCRKLRASWCECYHPWEYAKNDHSYPLFSGRLGILPRGHQYCWCWASCEELCHEVENCSRAHAQWSHNFL